MEVDAFVSSFDREFPNPDLEQSNRGSFLGKLFSCFRSKKELLTPDQMTAKKCALVQSFAFEVKNDGKYDLSGKHFVDGACDCNIDKVKQFAKQATTFTKDEKDIIDTKFQKISDMVHSVEEAKQDLLSKTPTENTFQNIEKVKLLLAKSDGGSSGFAKTCQKADHEQLASIVDRIFQASDSLDDETLNDLMHDLMGAVHNRGWLGRRSAKKEIILQLLQSLDPGKEAHARVLESMLSQIPEGKFRSVLAHTALTKVDLKPQIKPSIEVLKTSIRYIQADKLGHLLTRKKTEYAKSKAQKLISRLDPPQLQELFKEIESEKTRSLVLGDAMMLSIRDFSCDKLQCLVDTISNPELKDELILKSLPLVERCIETHEKDRLLVLANQLSSPKAKLDVLLHKMKKTKNPRLADQSVAQMLVKIGDKETLDKLLMGLDNKSLKRVLNKSVKENGDLASEVNKISPDQRFAMASILDKHIDDPKVKEALSLAAPVGGPFSGEEMSLPDLMNAFKAATKYENSSYVLGALKSTVAVENLDVREAMVALSLNSGSDEVCKAVLSEISKDDLLKYMEGDLNTGYLSTFSLICGNLEERLEAGAISPEEHSQLKLGALIRVRIEDFFDAFKELSTEQMIHLLDPELDTGLSVMLAENLLPYERLGELPGEFLESLFSKDSSVVDLFNSVQAQVRAQEKPSMSSLLELLGRVDNLALRDTLISSQSGLIHNFLKSASLEEFLKLTQMISAEEKKDEVLEEASRGFSINLHGDREHFGEEWLMCIGGMSDSKKLEMLSPDQIEAIEVSVVSKISTNDSESLDYFIQALPKDHAKKAIAIGLQKGHQDTAQNRDKVLRTCLQRFENPQDRMSILYQDVEGGFLGNTLVKDGDNLTSFLKEVGSDEEVAKAIMSSEPYVTSLLDIALANPVSVRYSVFNSLFKYIPEGKIEEALESSALLASTLKNRVEASMRLKMLQNLSSEDRLTLKRVIQTQDLDASELESDLLRLGRHYDSYSQFASRNGGAVGFSLFACMSDAEKCEVFSRPGMKTYFMDALQAKNRFVAGKVFEDIQDPRVIQAMLCDAGYQADGTLLETLIVKQNMDVVEGLLDKIDDPQVRDDILILHRERGRGIMPVDFFMKYASDDLKASMANEDQASVMKKYIESRIERNFAQLFPYLTEENKEALFQSNQAGVDKLFNSILFATSMSLDLKRGLMQAIPKVHLDRMLRSEQFMQNLEKNPFPGVFDLLREATEEALVPGSLLLNRAFEARNMSDLKEAIRFCTDDEISDFMDQVIDAGDQVFSMSKEECHLERDKGVQDKEVGALLFSKFTPEQVQAFLSKANSSKVGLVIETFAKKGDRRSLQKVVEALGETESGKQKLGEALDNWTVRVLIDQQNEEMFDLVAPYITTVTRYMVEHALPQESSKILMTLIEKLPRLEFSHTLSLPLDYKKQDYFAHYAGFKHSPEVMEMYLKSCVHIKYLLDVKIKDIAKRGDIRVLKLMAPYIDVKKLFADPIEDSTWMYIVAKDYSGEVLSSIIDRDFEAINTHFISNKGDLSKIIDKAFKYENLSALDVLAKKFGIESFTPEQQKKLHELRARGLHAGVVFEGAPLPKGTSVSLLPQAAGTSLDELVAIADQSLVTRSADETNPLDGSLSSSQRSSILKIVNNIKNRNPLAGMPNKESQPAEFEETYQSIEAVVKNMTYALCEMKKELLRDTVPQSRKDEIKERISIALFELSEIGGYCATRYRQDLPKVYRSYLQEFVADVSSDESISADEEAKDQVLSAVYDFKSGVLQSVYAQVAPNSNVHTLSGFMKSMKRGLGLPKNVDGGDPLANWNYDIFSNLASPNYIATLMQREGFTTRAIVERVKEMVDSVPFGESNPYQEALKEVYAEEMVKDLEDGPTKDKAWGAAKSEALFEVFDFDMEMYMPKLHKNSKDQDCGSVKEKWIEKLLIKWGVLK